MPCGNVFGGLFGTLQNIVNFQNRSDYINGYSTVRVILIPLRCLLFDTTILSTNLYYIFVPIMRNFKVSRFKSTECQFQILLNLFHDKEILTWILRLADSYFFQKIAFSRFKSHFLDLVLYTLHTAKEGIYLHLTTFTVIGLDKNIKFSFIF